MSATAASALPAPGEYTMGEAARIRGLRVAFGDTEVLHGVDLDIPAARTLALVGQSGSGKSTLALAVSRLLSPRGVHVSGEVHVGEHEVLGLRGEQLRHARTHLVAYLAQDASVALNPLMVVGEQIADAYRMREGLRGAAARDRAVEGLAAVGMRDPRSTFSRYPHQLSGGMRQRVMIAIALALRPSLLVADEPTTALDATVQKEILHLVRGLQDQFGLTVLWITHDLSVVAEIADEVAVMRDGLVLEQQSAIDLFDRPRHEYTRSLLASAAAARGLTVPASDPETEDRA
jgi:ABC-type glutathione transport system ATPase component